MSGFLQCPRRISTTGLAGLAFVGLISGCSHHHRPASSRAPQTAPELKAPRPAPPPPAAAPPATASNLPPGRIPPTPLPPGGVTQEDVRYVNTHPPLLTEVGLATWYSAPYKGRKAANGEVPVATGRLVI